MKEDYIEKLIEGAGKRPTPDDKTSEEILVATRRAWRESVRKNKRRVLKQRIVAFNVAAVVLFGIWGFIEYQPFTVNEPTQEVGNIIFADNNYQLNDAKQSDTSLLHIGDTLTAGSDALISVRLVDNTQITFAPDTTIQFTGISTMHLITGRVFVDSPDQNTSVVIDTAWGSIQDIGTQFEITIGSNELKVAMREGKVKMDLGDSIEYASYKEGKGDVVHIDKAQQITREEISSTDAYWKWTMPAIKALNLENVSVYDTLLWAGRVSGKEITYTSNEVATLAKDTHFSTGSLQANMLDSVLPMLFETTTLNIKIDNNTITVFDNKN